VTLNRKSIWLGALFLLTPMIVTLPVFGAVWIYRRIRECQRVVVVRPAIEVVDLVAVRERLRCSDADWWNR
jgi:hypothetical protein